MSAIIEKKSPSTDIIIQKPTTHSLDLKCNYPSF